MSALPRAEFRLAPLTEFYVPAMVAIEDTLYEFPWTTGNFEDSFRAGYSVWGALGDAGLLAYSLMMIAVDDAHILNLSVDAAWQGRGIGRALLELCCTLAQERGCARVLLEVRPSNGVAQRLYATAGFQEIGRRKAYYPARGGREDALVLERVL